MRKKSLQKDNLTEKKMYLICEREMSYELSKTEAK